VVREVRVEMVVRLVTLLVMMMIMMRMILSFGKTDFCPAWNLPHALDHSSQPGTLA
jgi:hypothetical protein